MIIEKTPLEGLLVIKPRVFNDERGYFFESFNSKKFAELTGHKLPFVQDNESKSTKGVLRGLHYQLGEAAQSKLVRVVKGSVLDVAVDIRKNSPSFGKHFAIELNQDNKLQFFIPRGFAHGFLVLSDDAIFQYKVDNFYSPDNQGVINYDDTQLNIDWGVDKENLILSDSDRNAPCLKDAKIY